VVLVEGADEGAFLGGGEGQRAGGDPDLLDGVVADLEDDRARPMHDEIPIVLADGQQRAVRQAAGGGL
jgi:hypothetical protein